MISRFKGEIPRISPFLLPDDYAQSAINCNTERGQLTIGEALVSELTHATNGTIWLTDSRWIIWPGDVDIVKGFDQATLPGHIYYTDGTKPKETTLALALPAGASGQAPDASVRLGVPQPDQLTSYQINSTTGQSARDVSYCYVCVTSTGKRSRPSTATPTITLTETQIVQFDMTEFAGPSGSSDADISEFYLYRLAVGTTGAEYQLVPYLGNASSPGIPVGTTGNWEDNQADSALLEELPSGAEYWYEPETDLTGLIQFRDGILAGFVGNTVYMSEPYKPYAWPYSFEFHDAIVGLGVDGGTLVVMTDGATGLLNGFDPDAMAQTYANYYQPCLSKASICSTPYGVLFASPDGIVESRNGKVITKFLWTKTLWDAETPASMISVFNDDKYYCFQDDGGFYFDVTSLECIYRYDFASNDISCVMVDGETIYFGLTDAIYSLTGTATSYIWKSKKYKVKKRQNLSHAQVITDSPVTFTLFVNGYETEPVTTHDDTVFRTYNSYQAQSFELQLTGNANVDAMSVGATPDEVLYGK